jgi:hypothetical protein
MVLRVGVRRCEGGRIRRVREAGGVAKERRNAYDIPSKKGKGDKEHEFVIVLPAGFDPCGEKTLSYILLREPQAGGRYGRITDPASVKAVQALLCKRKSPQEPVPMYGMRVEILDGLTDDIFQIVEQAGDAIVSVLEKDPVLLSALEVIAANYGDEDVLEILRQIREGESVSTETVTRAGVGTVAGPAAKRALKVLRKGLQRLKWLFKRDRDIELEPPGNTRSVSDAVDAVDAGKRSRAVTQRELDLGRDPASGGKLKMHEVDCATTLEQRVGKLTRDPSGKGDWIDARGKVYDGIGPVKEGAPYKIDDFIDSIRRHLASKNKAAVDEFVVDVRRLNANEVAQVERVVDSLRGTTTRTISIQR